MAEPDTWINAVRESHDRFAAAVGSLDDDAVTSPSYASEWSIADVASHLGSQAEIFGLFLDAGLHGEPAPGAEAFGPIWEQWNARTPQQQVTDSVAANERFVATLEQLPEADRARFELSAFGMELDLAGVLALRLAEHALHTWDVSVALDPGAVLAPEAVELLIDRLGATVARSGQPTSDDRSVVIETVEPSRSFVLTTGPQVALTATASGDAAALHLPSEALVRLVYGRLDAERSPAGSDAEALLAQLRAVFPGF
jgi:uncharacterized protein (TIGR03083 family)